MSEYINLQAFSTGYKAFNTGQRLPYRFNEDELKLIWQRSKYLKFNKRDTIRNRFLEKGIILVDDGQKTLGYKIHIAVNPYLSDTYSYKEWQRGFDTAYFNNLKRTYK